jgi:hypothetical protein
LDLALAAEAGKERTNEGRASDRRRCFGRAIERPYLVVRINHLDELIIADRAVFVRRVSVFQRESADAIEIKAGDSCCRSVGRVWRARAA